MEYVFCEFCQTEVESNKAWVLDHQPICEKCWGENFDEKKPDQPCSKHSNGPQSISTEGDRSFS